MTKPVAVYFLDTAVNMGGSFAVKTLQKSVGVEIDGVIGPNTLKFVGIIDDGEILKKMRSMRIERYKQHRECEKFCKGW